MTKQNIMNRMLGVAALAMIFGAAPTFAQSASSNRPDATANDAQGKSPDNYAGRMTPTGENESTSVTPVAPNSSRQSGASGSASRGSSGKADATSVDATGKTRENRHGRMSPTGENESTSVTPAK